MNKFIKFFVSIVLCAVFCVGVCACGNDKKGDSGNSDPLNAGDDYQDDIFD